MARSKMPRINGTAESIKASFFPRKRDTSKMKASEIP
jgi:hypothetical protein